MSVVRHHSGLQALMSANMKYRQEAPFVTYMYGPTGSGKTQEMKRYCIEKFTKGVIKTWKYGDPTPDGFNDFVYVKTPTASSSGSNWFTNLTSGHEILVFEEFSSHSGPLTFFTSLINSGPCLLPTFGGMVSCMAKEVWILSNHAPETLWPGVEEAARKAFLRRLKDPHTGKVVVWGYGPQHDLMVCPCLAPAQCPYSHEDSGPVAIAVGAKLPPPGGFLRK